MTDETIIREAEPADATGLEKLYGEAFTDEDLYPLVKALLSDRQNTLTLCALNEGAITGHIALTRCHAIPENIPLALLGPLAVSPSCQGKGVGSRLIGEGLDWLKRDQVAKVFVLGDPNYYGRSGFCEEGDVLPAFPIPDEWKPAWQSIRLNQRPVAPSGKLTVTPPWQRPELWS